MVDYETEADLEGEESWTFIGDENEVDPGLRRRLSGRSSLHEPNVNLGVLRAGGRSTRIATNLDAMDRR